MRIGFIHWSIFWVNSGLVYSRKVAIDDIYINFIIKIYQIFDSVNILHNVLWCIAIIWICLIF